jgi:hypothetical protein
LKIPDIKTIELLLATNRDELFEYLKDYDSSLRSTDAIEIIHFDYGIKMLYYHSGVEKPYKTRVYLNKMEDTDLLR